MSLWLRINTAKVAQGLGPLWPHCEFYCELHFLFKENRLANKPFELASFKTTNEEITAFSGHKQGRFLRYYYHSRWYSIKVFIAHIIVLLSLNSSFNWNATANLTNRENFREKFRRKIRVERIFARKVGPNYW